MSNLYDAFLGLIPSYPTLVGTVTAVSGERHTITLVGGGSILCTSQKAYPLQSSVFIQKKVIVSEAPNNVLVTFTV